MNMRYFQSLLLLLALSACSSSAANVDSASQGGSTTAASGGDTAKASGGAKNSATTKKSATASSAAEGGVSHGGAENEGGASAADGGDNPANGGSSARSSKATGGSSNSGTAGSKTSSTGGTSGSSKAGSSTGGASSTKSGSSGETGGTKATTTSSTPAGTAWVGTWVTAQQLTETANNPPSPGLSNSTLRQVVHVSIGGSKLRMQFSNAYGNGPVTITKAHLAAAGTASAIDTATDTEIMFDGKPSVTLAAKQEVVSDPFDFDLKPLSNVTVSIYFGSTASDVTGHPGSRTTSYLKSGDSVSAANLSGAATADHWYIISEIDVMAEADTHALAILGDSITDGRDSTTNGNDRWPDALAKRLQANDPTTKVGVLNQGIGGNAVLSGGLGPTAKARFDHDILKPAGVRWAIVYEGVNDLGGGATSANLIAAYKDFIAKAHAANIKVYGATITPFGGNSYYSADHESNRKAVNDWIRGKDSGYDAVIDFDAAIRDSADPTKIQAAYTTDGLHCKPAGYQKMADAIDLSLFSE